MADLTNKFFDINKLPDEWGILLFPISMSRIANAQSPEACLEYLRHLSPSKVRTPSLGLHFLYGNELYLDYDLSEGLVKDPHEQRMKYIQEVEKHKFGMLKIIKKYKTTEFQIPHAFEFMSWDQGIIIIKSFATRLKELRKMYEADKKFQKYMKEDAKSAGKKLSEAQINFFLEEHLLSYLATKGEMSLSNRHVQDRQKWVLWCYPGKPPKAQIYLHQLNPFDLEWRESPYQTVVQYDLEEHKLYDSKNIDLDTLEY